MKQWEDAVVSITPGFEVTLLSALVAWTIDDEYAVTFLWDSDTRLNEVQLQISDAIDFSNLLYDEFVSKDSGPVTQDLPLFTQLYSRVRVRSSTLRGRWSNVVLFALDNLDG